MNEFISGALVMGYLVAGLYFLRYWRASRDRLFALFALAFWVLALQRFALAASTLRAPNSPDTFEGHPFLYIVRLVAFLLILVAIIDKNRSDKVNL